MNKKHVAAIAAMAGIAAQAATLPGLNDFAKIGMHNSAKVEGASFAAPAYVKSIEMVTVKSGERMAAVELGDQSMPAAYGRNIVVAPNAGDVVCMLPAKEAGKLEVGKAYDVKGKVLGTGSQLVKGLYGHSNRLVITASCDMRLRAGAEPAAQAPAPAPKAAPPAPAGVSSVSGPDQDSHCIAGETVVFACSTGKKLISVCAAPGLVQYRFGPKGAPELKWPESPTQADIVTAGNLMYSGGGGAYLRFRKPGTDYVVYTAEGRDWTKEGVAVQQGGKAIANVACKGVARVSLSSSKLGLKEDTTAFQIP